ncbi:MAG: hypothetical protein GXX84_19095 [Acidobacteria bacterium]|nr:hypothetical protein [Acidobacteriota bacterium]
MDLKKLAGIVDELIEIMELQAAELEKLLTHVQRVTPRMGYQSEIPAVAAGMKKLRIEMKKLLEE